MFFKRSATNPIDPRKFAEGDGDYIMHALLPVFGKGIAPYAGQMNPMEALASGIREVTKFLFYSDLPCVGKPTRREWAVTLAASVAVNIGYENDELERVKPKVMVYVNTLPLTPCKPKASAVAGSNLRRLKF